jgi:hypothetical protein
MLTVTAKAHSAALCASFAALCGKKRFNRGGPQRFTVEDRREIT